MLWKKNPSRKVVFGVREPIARFVSGFNSRLRQGQPTHYTPWSPSEAIAFHYFKTPNELAEGLTDGNPLTKSIAEMSMWAIKHVNKPYYIALCPLKKMKDNIDKIEFVYVVERMQEDFKRLLPVLGINEEMELPSDDVACHRSPEGMNKNLSPQAIENLKSWYVVDFEIYHLLSNKFSKK